MHNADFPGIRRVNKPPLPPIVDTHQHLWDLRSFHLPWTKGQPALVRSFVMDDYLQATVDLRIAQCVYMEVDVAPAEQEAEARWVLELCQRDDNPTSAAVISGRPAEQGFHDYVLKFKGSPTIKGVRQVLHVPETPPGYCLDAQFVRGIQFLGERGLSFDLCMSQANCWMPTSWWPNVRTRGSLWIIAATGTCKRRTPASAGRGSRG